MSGPLRNDEQMFEPARLGPAVRWRRKIVYMRAWILTPSGWWAELEWLEVCLVRDGKPAAATITASVHASRLSKIEGQDYERVPRRGPGHTQ